MVYKSVDNIVTDVKVCFDEIGLNDSEFLTDTDNTEMNAIIESKIIDALRFVNLHADAGYLEPTVIDANVTAENGVVDYPLPEDFLRMLYAKLSDWLHVVTVPIFYTEKEYATLKNPITTGYPDNPKVAITANKHLELYTTKSSDAKLTFGYIGEAKPNNNNEWPIPEKVYRGVVYYIAGLTLLTYKDAHADALMNQAMMMIGAKTN